MLPLTPEDPTLIGSYQLLKVLGEGGMGRVYLARSPGFRLVALKVIHREYATDPGFRERFRREAAAARSVSEFYTTPVIEADPDAEQPWLATVYLPAPSLEEFVDRFGAMKEPAVRTLGAGLAEALSAIHQAGLAHRDLHPANVLLTREGPQIIDFGISRAQEVTRVTRTGAMIGTPGYMSPEQIVRERSSEPAAREPGAGHPGDVFSLGCVLAFAATGSGPFGTGNARARLRRAVYEEPSLEHLPGSLRPIVAACLDKNPARRPGAADLLKQLSPVSPHTLLNARLRGELDERERRADLISRGPVHPEPGEGEPPAEKKAAGHGVRPRGPSSWLRGRGRLFGILAGAVALLTVVGVVLAFTPSGSDPDPGPGSGESAPPEVKPNSPWSLTVGQADILKGMWSTPSRVVLGTPSGLTAYNPDTGAKLWSWKPPGGVLCNMSHTTSGGIGAITYGTFNNTVGGEECDRLQTISVSSGALNWTEAISLEGRGSTGIPNLAGGESLSIGGGVVSAPFAGAADLISVSVRTGKVGWSTGSTESGIKAMVDGCSLSGLAQVLKGTVYALGQCGDGQGELLAFRKGSTPSIQRVASLPGCAGVSNTTISGFMTANEDYLLIGCGGGHPSSRVYTLAAGSTVPNAVDLSGVAVTSLGALYSGDLPPVNVLMADSTLYLVKGQNVPLGGTQDGVVAVDMATGEQRWARKVAGTSSVRLLAATGSGVFVLGRGTGTPALYTLTAANGEATKKYALNTSQADTFNNPYDSQIPYAVPTHAHVAIGIPWALKPDQTVLVVLPTTPSVDVL